MELFLAVFMFVCGMIKTYMSDSRLDCFSCLLMGVYAGVCVSSWLVTSKLR